MATWPVRAMLTMTVPPQDGADFEREWNTVAAWVQNQPGCLRQTLTRVAADDRITYVISSDWTDRGTYTQFETSSRQDDATAGLRRLRTSVHMEVLDIIDDRGTR